MVDLTIITPTYNRGVLLKKCWESLCAQTNMNFQWLIIDDGSTDDTEKAVNEFKQLSPQMEIDYVYKSNGGKHTALNESHSYIKGKYVVILDSDDIFIHDAVNEIVNAWKKYDEETDVGIIYFLRGTPDGQPLCYVKHYDVPLDTINEPRFGSNSRDCCDTFRTELFVRYKFPVFEGERFIGEGAAFFPMELESKGVYINKVIYICEYLTDGLTKAGRKMRLNNPKGGMYNSKVYMDRHLPLKTRIKKGILYSCYSRFAHVGFINAVKENKYKFLTVITYLPGLMLSIYWRRKYFG